MNPSSVVWSMRRIKVQLVCVVKTCRLSGVDVLLDRWTRRIALRGGGGGIIVTACIRLGQWHTRGQDALIPACAWRCRPALE
jgi:hypothetical protein